MVVLNNPNENLDPTPQGFYGKDAKLVDKDIKINQNNDLTVVQFEDNITQAIINRLATPIGTLPEHPDYGSELNFLIGDKATALVLQDAKSFVFAALKQEPRVDKIKQIKVNFDIATQTLEFDVTVTLIITQAELNLVWDYFIG